MSPDNILLRLVDDQEAQVRAIFDELEDRGFPRQNQTPHITITFSPHMQSHVVERAAEILPPLIPCTFRRVGTVIFGTKRKQTIAWLLDAPDALEIAARELSALNPDGRGPRWTPHLTMGLRVPRRLVHEYLAALEQITPPHFNQLTADRALLWRPKTQETTHLSGTITDKEK